VSLVRGIAPTAKVTQAARTAEGIASNVRIVRTSGAAMLGPYDAREQ
jgi:hypothetical protein